MIISKQNNKISMQVTIGLIALLMLSACSMPSGLSVSNPFGKATTDGIVDHGMYKAIKANKGDTMQTLAARAGVDVNLLAAHNSVSVDHTPIAGREYAIPGGASIGATTPTSALPADTLETSKLGNETTTHRVKDGETAYSIARLYGVSVTSLSSWNNLGPELTVSNGQQLIIPLSETPNGTATTPPVEVASLTTPTAASSGFQSPVVGTVSTRYDPANNSDGMVYSTGVQAPVKSTSGGKVVLISKSTGANGTIVMVQHPNGLISVYGKLGSVNVEKGQEVSAGQLIGSTSGSQLLFQLRNGTKSVDPETYI